MVEIELRDFVLGGVALEGKAKERFNEIQQELAQVRDAIWVCHPLAELCIMS